MRDDARAVVTDTDACISKSLFHALKTELIYRLRFRHRDEARWTVS